MNIRIKRILAAVIDFVIILLLAGYGVAIITLGKLTTTPFTITVYLVIGLIVLIVKDIALKNASIGKRIFKICVVKIDGTRLSIIDAMKRSIIMVLILPIEIVLIETNGRRIGDIWAKTLVCDKLEKDKIKQQSTNTDTTA